MDKGKEKGILKLEPRPRVFIDTRSELTPQMVDMSRGDHNSRVSSGGGCMHVLLQMASTCRDDRSRRCRDDHGSGSGSCDHGPVSPQPSVDRLSVTWADPGSMTSSGVNLFHLPSETPVNNEVKFSPSAGEGSEDEDYSASLSAVLRQRRASVRRSRKGRTRRPSSPFLADEGRSRRRSSVFTTSSGDTAISMEEGLPTIVTQEQIFANIHLHKEVLGSVKQQPLGMRRKLKIVYQAKTYIKRHEGQLQERLAQSKSTRDIYARFNILLTTKWQQLKREAANTSNLLIPWELRIKEIESHFGSVVASYFTFLRWLFWVNLVIGFILLVFVIIPEYLTADPKQDGQRKIIEDSANATNLLTLWQFEGVLKYTPIFYGYYSNIARPQYWMPLAYFLTGLVVYIYSFVAILRKMAENSRMSKLSEKEDECIFSWKLFTGWDFMIGNAETAHNRIASVILGFKEALLEEAEKKKDLRNWRIISLRGVVNICVVILLAVSAYAVVTVVSRSDDNPKSRSWWRDNETTIVVTLISITFPVFFELLGFLEHYHPRKQLRLQLARIMLLNLLNLYSLIFALFSKIEGMSNDLDNLKPQLIVNATHINITKMGEDMVLHIPTFCYEERVSCELCINEARAKETHMELLTSTVSIIDTTIPIINFSINNTANISNQFNRNLNFNNSPTVIKSKKYPLAENLIENDIKNETEITTPDSLSVIMKELERLRNLSGVNENLTEANESTSEVYDYETSIDTSDDFSSSTISSIDINDTFYIINMTSHFHNDHSTTDEYTESNIITDSSSTDDFEFTLTETSSTLSSEPFETSGSPYYDTESTGMNSIQTSTTDSDKFYISTDNLLATTMQTEMYDTLPTADWTKSTIYSNESAMFICPKILNYTLNCNGFNITQVYGISKCLIVKTTCYRTICEKLETPADSRNNNETMLDIVYLDEKNRRMYNLTDATKKKLLKLCWETMFGQELVKLTMMDLVFVLLGMFTDFFRALFVRYMNRCWCWDLEKKFPEYGDFKIAEFILHLINNQGMVWMGMFFSPGLVVLNVVKLIIMMYLRSWAVMTCNVPHEVVFRVSKSNNFYLALLLTMLFLCVLPVGYTIVWVKPSWHCGPFSEYDRIYHILTNNIYSILPKTLNFALEYIASPAIVIPLLVLLILIIYYLTSLTNSLREANNDLKIQLRRERTEERRKMFQLADTRRRVGSSAMDNTPFARWKKALPSLPLSKSIDSDDRKPSTVEDTSQPRKIVKKKESIFAKIVGMAVDKKPEVELVSEVIDEINNGVTPPSNNIDDETDTDFHESLPKEILRIKDIIFKNAQAKKKSNAEFKPDNTEKHKNKTEDKGLRVKLEAVNDRTEKKSILEKQKQGRFNEAPAIKSKSNEAVTTDASDQLSKTEKKLNRKQTSESSNQSKQSDSIGSVIPVIMISTTESDEELLQSKEGPKDKQKHENDQNSKSIAECLKKIKKSSSDLKSLRRQSSVDSMNEQKLPKEKKTDSGDGHKYQYSL